MPKHRKKNRYSITTQTTKNDKASLLGETKRSLRSVQTDRLKEFIQMKAVDVQTDFKENPAEVG